MTDRQGPDWARGLLAVGLLLLIVGAFTLWPLCIVGFLMILFVGASTASQRRASGKPPETLLRPGDRPWRRGDDQG
ncbi:hypothetical protein ABT237_41955 [Streptomyces sp. NPDC001581]|uniref:hypothetical protein n=1 Tax=unclassified Streptomyces TaxID=2593676 RepID=UPI00332FA80E